MADAQIVPVPDRVGQGTAIEQSRAAAEVLGSIEAAQRWPRDPQRARRELHIACGMMHVAEHAFYSYRKAGSLVEGSTVLLARTIAGVWGNIQHGVDELRRDDEFGQSELRAWAWDVEKAVRSSRIFILPHKLYTKRDAQRMVDLREIQDNNSSVGGRAVREMIFAVLPPWLKLEAEDLCRRTLTEGELDANGKRVQLPPLPVRIGEVIDWFAAKLEIDERQLAAKLDRPSSRWSVHDVVTLGNLGRSIVRGEISKADAFPPAVVTGAQIISAAPPPVQDEVTSDE